MTCFFGQILNPTLTYFLGQREYVISPFQVISHLGFSKFIDFSIHLGIYICRCVVESMNLLENSKRLIIWDGGNMSQFENFL